MRRLIIGGVFAVWAGLFAWAYVTNSEPQIEPRVVDLRISHKEDTVNESKSRKVRVQELKAGSACSGAFVSNNGDIITAAHCLRDAEEIMVRTYDNQVYKATFVATATKHDLGLIHIDRQGTSFFQLANSVKRGEQIFILGSPLAIPNTLSTGIVAKLDGDRMLVDCSALPGNSGSTVFNARGELVGVLVAGYIVGLGTTHLNVAQSVDSVRFFLKRTKL